MGLHPVLFFAAVKVYCRFFDAPAIHYPPGYSRLPFLENGDDIVGCTVTINNGYRGPIERKAGLEGESAVAKPHSQQASRNKLIGPACRTGIPGPAAP